MNKTKLWLRWVAVNALGEMVGLGLTFAVGVWAMTRVNLQGVAMVLVSFLVAVASGGIEATIVGLAQHWAMQPWFPQIKRFAWWRGTFWGALTAYMLGYLPSTIMSLGEETSGAAPLAEPAQWMVLLLAAGLGLVGGAVLSFAQWLVLRKIVRRAGRWIPANMLAWAFGMPLIFWGIDAAQKGQPLWQGLVQMAAVLLVTGALVGAIHGWFLAGMANEKI